MGSQLFASLSTPKQSLLYAPLCKFKSSNPYVDKVIVKAFIDAPYNSMWLLLRYVSMSINIMSICKHTVAVNVAAKIQHNFYKSDIYHFPPLECR